MKIAICGSLSFAKEMGELKEKLNGFGFEVEVPYSAVKILKGEFSQEGINKSKEDGTFHKITIENDAIRKWHDVIQSCDAILVVNYDKKGISNYVGGSVFLEIGFAHIMNKKIYLLNPIPEVSYKDEIIAMQPIILEGNLLKIK
ncbi:MAG: hypothetical protein COV33_00030 [Candidatus Zambryskibacteria bacterium CG10_big_fil_rev_8_21_14_0_10_34_34]|uniref:Maf-like protein n=1 Tax=Candidatus Zambryskibacteria bacterium CG10_big_fil_rev_8_21_14_0_10_34_34 TaxID=1975114 RepID=A0A2H0R1H6_9BACT|nr:MAG: hypothetical protein COV33_00030 [Candidatus Zambryskibacteria bacterium CG10_big_fil_rev_8_21_14_0_10_34_34]